MNNHDKDTLTNRLAGLFANRGSRLPRLAITAALVVHLLPAPALAAGLDDTVLLGLARHPQINAAMAEVEQAGTEVSISKAGYYPRLEISAGPESLSMNDFGYSLTASQMLYDWGRVSSKVAIASARLRQQMANLLVTREEAALDIAETYLDVLLYQQRVQSVERYRTRLAGLREMIVKRGAKGYADSTEQGRIDLALARSREQLAIEQGSLQDAQSQYQMLIGERPDGLSQPDEALIISRLNNDAVLQDAVDNAPLYRKAQEDVATAEANVDGAKASLLPQLNLEGSLLRREIGGTMTDDSVVGLRLRMDTLEGFSNFQRPKAERQRLDATRWSLDTVQRDLRRKLNSLFETESVLLWREEALANQLKQADNVRNAYKKQFMVGMRDITDTITIENEYFEADRQLANARSERLRVQYRAAAQIGWLVPLFEGRELGGQI